MQESIFRDIPPAGVVYAVHEATRAGYARGDASWCNLGQGQPEVGPINGAPPRIQNIELEPQDHAYGPSGGTNELRDAVAAHYNRLYRVGTPSQYTRNNVLVASGGRIAITRMFRTLGAIRLGYRYPDYTSYEDSLRTYQHKLEPIAVGDADDPTRFGPKAFRAAIEKHRLNALLLSNPCNPSGHVVRGQELEECVRIARTSSCALLVDEFYSHYIYDPDGSPAAEPVSCARYVEDVDRDPVLIVDGITKNFRSPGWRLGWVVAPESWVAPMSRVAGTLDGGPSMLAQRGALSLLDPARADLDTTAARRCFAAKRNFMVNGLRKLGIDVPYAPEGSMYVWGNVKHLRSPLNTDEGFFQAALKHRVITVPGRFFVLRAGSPELSPPPIGSYPWLRFSFGPPESQLVEGLARLGKMVTR